MNSFFVSFSIIRLFKDISNILRLEQNGDHFADDIIACHDLF